MLTHHAFLCRLPEVSEDEARTAAAQLNCGEVTYFSTEAFLIDDVRSLTEKAYMRPAVGEEQLLVVTFTTITVEAQQALLKLLEEPPRGTAFLFCVPDSVYLLPTVLSRFSELKADLVNDGRVGEVFAEFIAQTTSEQVIEVADRLTRKDVVWVASIKSGLIAHLRHETQRYSAEDLATLSYIAEHLQTRGAANKYLLEELAFTLAAAAEKP
jgi:DNA polymerase III delta prime subunit